MAKKKVLKVGGRAPNFCLADQENKKFCLKDLQGKWVVLYFYPKDNTSGCTKEAVAFSERVGEFKKMNATVVGVSKDSVKSHVNFIKKHNLKLTLLSDSEHKVLERYGAWKLKKMYGREFYGTVRTTYLINPKAKIAHIWNNVKPKGHIAEIIDTLQELM